MLRLFARNLMNNGTILKPTNQSVTGMTSFETITAKSNPTTIYLDLPIAS
jgi:hypothetical protein